MQKVVAFARKTDGSLMTAGTGTFQVYEAGTTTPVSIYSTDSTGAGAPSSTILVSGKIEFYARNGRIKVVATEGASTVTVDDIAVNAGVYYGTFSARPAAGSKDRLYVATDIGRAYYDNESAWKELPDFALDAMDWAAAADVVAGTTSDVFGGIGNYVEVTHASGTVAITALASSNATEGSPRLVKFTISGGTLSITHNATSCEILNGGANWTLATGDMAWVIGKGGSNVKVIPVAANGKPAINAWELAGVGQPIQSVYTEDATAVTTTSTIPFDDTIPQNTEGAEYTQIATSITPKYASSKLRVSVFLPIAGIGATDPFIGAIFRDSTADAIVAGSMNMSAASVSSGFYLEATVAASAATATTFKFRYGITGGNAYIGSVAGTAKFGTSRKACMTIQEIKQ